MRKPKQQQKPLNDLSRSLTPFDPNRTLTVVIEMGKESWLVAGMIPGVERQPLKKLEADENELLKLLERWRREAEKAGHKIDRVTVAFEAGRDGFWLARWLRARRIEAHVIHAASVAVSRASACQDRPARHRAAQTRLPRLAARRAGALQDVRDPDLRRGRCQAPSPRARDPRWRAHDYHQPHQGDPGAAGHPQLQSQAQEGAGAPGTPAHARGRADPAQYPRGGTSRHGAQAARC